MPALRPMTPTEFEAWQQTTIPAYAADKVASGQWTAAEAPALSAQEFATLLPEGQNTPDHHFRTITDDAGTAAGMLWFAVKTKFGAPAAYLFNIEIAPQHQRRGLGAFAMRALEEEARSLGLAGIALHVFGHNGAGRALYEGLGYEPTNISLFKRLPTSG